ncbi:MULTISPECIES: FeoB-associated Cys-rich membrane protein [Anoxybacillus]|nr:MULTISPECIES: FeoB-associated Cys-rich membrane protein [Anoxybacillus]MED0656960.1 FeoB-associated Cys-rich membrane protein [Anoxybacillus ayderensis]NNU97134.1 FeoB-associated Cys-rich membrane protein [Anoxybacillus sp. EFIL]
MIANVVIGSVIFGYAGWTIFRFIQKSKRGTCAACSVKGACGTSCHEKS